jgi:hypothetical protein
MMTWEKAKAKGITYPARRVETCADCGERETLQRQGKRNVYMTRGSVRTGPYVGYWYATTHQCAQRVASRKAMEALLRPKALVI